MVINPSRAGRRDCLFFLFPKLAEATAAESRRIASPWHVAAYENAKLMNDQATAALRHFAADDRKPLKNGGNVAIVDHRSEMALAKPILAHMQREKASNRYQVPPAQAFPAT
jgi:hypothetical protein